MVIVRTYALTLIRHSSAARFNSFLLFSSRRTISELGLFAPTRWEAWPRLILLSALYCDVLYHHSHSTGTANSSITFSTPVVCSAMLTAVLRAFADGTTLWMGPPAGTGGQ